MTTDTVETVGLTLDDMFRRTYALAINSPDPSTQNGAVLVDGKTGSIIGVGWNDFPSGVNTDHWHGEKEAKYARVVHAETSAILDAGRLGHATQGSILVCPWAACSNCAKHIAFSGVSALVRHPNNNGDTGNHWHDDCAIGDEIMTEADIQIVEYPIVQTNLVLRRNGEDWPPRG